MDRHHVLNLFDKLYEKYGMQEGEYKEFVEALGGKGSFTKDQHVEVVFDLIECVVEYSDDDDHMCPDVHTFEKCSRIWKIIPDENSYHGHGYIWNGYLKTAEMHRSAVQRLTNEVGAYVTMTLDTKTNRKNTIKIISVDII